MNRCPECGEEVPSNEWNAYRRHENCRRTPYAYGNGMAIHEKRALARGCKTVPADDVANMLRLPRPA